MPVLIFHRFMGSGIPQHFHIDFRKGYYAFRRRRVKDARMPRNRRIVKAYAHHF